MTQIRVLIAHHEQTVIEALAYNLLKRDYMVLTANDGFECLNIALSIRPELAIIDAQLPKLDGYEACRQIRQKSNAPIIMLSACDDEDAAFRGSTVGVDAYMVIPFSMSVLLSKVEQLVAGQTSGLPACIESGDLSIDAGHRDAVVNGRRIHLSPQPFRILQLLISQPRRMFSGVELQRHLWGLEIDTDLANGSALYVHIRKLREAIETDPSNPTRILSVRGLGWKFEPHY